MISRRLVGRVQGIISLLVALVTIVSGIVAASVLFALLMVMVGLLLAPPFGTLAYLAVWGFFFRGAGGGHALDLAVLEDCRRCVVGAGAARLHQEQGAGDRGRHLPAPDRDRSFLHGFPPGILVSITDVIGGLVILGVSIVWAIVLLFGSIGATLKAIPPEKTSA